MRKSTTKKATNQLTQEDSTQQSASQRQEQQHLSSSEPQDVSSDRFKILLEQLKNAPIQSISIHNIEIDQDFQVRKDSNRKGNFAGGLWKNHFSATQVTRYARIYADDRNELPPIILGQIEGQEDSSYFVIDGFHRVYAYRRCIEQGKADWLYWKNATTKKKYKIGYDLMSAKVITIKNKEEGRYIASHINSQHGLPLTRAEMKARIFQYVDAGLHLDQNGKFKSLRAIAKDLHIARNTIKTKLKRNRPEILEAIMKEHGREEDLKSHLIKCPRSEEDKLCEDPTIGRLIAVQQSYRRSGPKKRNDIMTALVALFLEGLRIDEWEADGRATMKDEELSFEDQIIRKENPYDIPKYVIEARNNHFTGLDCIRYKESCAGLMQAIEDRRKKELEEELNSDY